MSPRTYDKLVALILCPWTTRCFKTNFEFQKFITGRVWDIENWDWYMEEWRSGNFRILTKRELLLHQMLEVPTILLGALFESLPNITNNFLYFRTPDYSANSSNRFHNIEQCLRVGLINLIRSHAPKVTRRIA